MKELKEVVTLVGSGRIGKIQGISDSDAEGDSLLYRFYKGISEGYVKTDEEAREFLYNENVGGSRYTMLKQRLFDKLYTTLLFVEPREKSAKSYFYNYYYCHKHMIVAKLLVGLGANNAGRKLMDKVIKKALDYELFEIVAHAALAMRRQFMLSGDDKKYLYYRDLFDDSVRKVQADARAEDLYNNISIHFIRSANISANIIKSIETSLAETGKLKNRHKTYMLQYYHFNLRAIYYELKGNFKKVLQISNRFEKYLVAQHRFYSTLRHGHLMLVQVNCYLHLREYRKGIELGKKAGDFYHSGSINWFQLMGHAFLLHLNNHEPENAFLIYQKVTEHARFENIDDRQKEIWKIYGGYLWFYLKYIERDDLIRKMFPQSEQFNFNKMINEVPIFSKDKKGYNVAVIILQVLTMLQKADLVGVINRADALKSYSQKHLRKEDAERSRIFILMIRALDRADFNPRLIRTKTKKHLQKLQAEGVKYKPTQGLIEILPYEELWAMILNILEKKSLIVELKKMNIAAGYGNE
jgi:hypothetical protein